LSGPSEAGRSEEDDGHSGSCERGYIVVVSRVDIGGEPSSACRVLGHTWAPTRARWLTTVALGCVGCGFSSSRPPDASGPIDGSSTGSPDAAPDGPTNDGGTPLVCYGASGEWQVCLDAVPTNTVVLPQLLDTDRAGGLCAATQPAGWRPAQPESCFIIGATIISPLSIATLVTGSRPLVLVGHLEIAISTALDFAAHEREDNSVVLLPRGDCAPFSSAPGNGQGGGAGGGAGGSFMSQGGNGAQGGSLVDSAGGIAAPASSDLPAHLRGGCPGQRGGARLISDEGIGRGGGAVYLASHGTILIARSGSINVSGAGAAGSGVRTGGSGGGSGGVVVLAAPTITIDGTVLANGGGGAGGDASGRGGADGEDPSVLQPTDGGAGGGNGGHGFGTSAEAGGGTVGRSNDDGGGGGGGGAGLIRATVDLGAAKISPRAHIVP
jgi:hypothetical protein